jgi:hypothetical protein
MLNDRSITTVCKVIGGLSADDFGLDLVVIQAVGASLQILSGGQFIADFYRKNYHGQTII